jgi:hypothetical protein
MAVLQLQPAHNVTSAQQATQLTVVHHRQLANVSPHQFFS